MTIDHNLPSRDYDDLMDMVDSTLAMGFIDEDRLYVSGCSAGGTLTAWIVGKTDRCWAAAVINPAINAVSWGLIDDVNKQSVNGWYADVPCNDPMDCWFHSPLSLLKNVTTPTMIMIGEEDWRTPISESESESELELYLTALQVKRVITLLPRLPGASHCIEARLSHWIEARPSHLIVKVNAIFARCERYGKQVTTSIRP